eukprot:m.80792 g.80792  ORF g.80792 m.80792 type:complete len:439 (+) comp14222_c0_seq4:457-1773(+)
MAEVVEDEVLTGYDEDVEQTTVADLEADKPKDVKGSYSGLHSAGFKDFSLKPELLRAIRDCGFEHPSEVQQECIPQALIGTDVICQAKSGMGKTAVFVISVLDQIKPVEGEVSCIVLCHARELADQIHKEFMRFSAHMSPQIRCEVFFGGIKLSTDIEKLRNPPHIVVGTPGRLYHLMEEGHLKLGGVKFFIIDECDKVLKPDARAVEKGSDGLDMRRKVQSLHMKCPRNKQVMMFTATLDAETRALCRRFMHNPMEVCVDDDAKLKLRSLKQYYVKLTEEQKTRKLLDLLDSLEFNQVIIFLSSQARVRVLAKLLEQENFPVKAIHGGMRQESRIENYQEFKSFKARILVATDVFGRGMDIERVNIVINYDMPEDTDTYLHRVARAGRFGTKGLAVTFVSTPEEAEILNKTQGRFDVDIAEMPETLDKSEYMADDSA